MCDRTNDDIDVSNCRITREELSNVVCKPYNPNIKDGDSIQSLGVSEINRLISQKTPEDGVYRFSRMDDNFEYRVIVKGDFDYGTYRD